MVARFAEGCPEAAERALRSWTEFQRPPEILLSSRVVFGFQVEVAAVNPRGGEAGIDFEGVIQRLQSAAVVAARGAPVGQADVALDVARVQPKGAGVVRLRLLPLLMDAVQLSSAEVQIATVGRGRNSGGQIRDLIIDAGVADNGRRKQQDTQCCHG